MCKESDQTLFPGRAIFDDLVADQECLDAGFGEVRHKSYSSEVLSAVKRIRVSLESDGLRIRWKGVLGMTVLCRSENAYPMRTLPPRLSTTSPNIVSPVPIRQ